MSICSGKSKQFTGTTRSPFWPIASYPKKIAILWGNRNNVYLIFSRQWIDTNTLMKLALILGHDFFADLSRSYREQREQPGEYINGMGGKLRCDPRPANRAVRTSTKGCGCRGRLRCHRWLKSCPAHRQSDRTFFRCRPLRRDICRSQENRPSWDIQPRSPHGVGCRRTSPARFLCLSEGTGRASG